jgi:signal transduction histidine kinase
MELLTGKMLTAQEDEKKRIADLLHEEIIQTLGGVKLYLEHSISTPVQNGSGDSTAAGRQIIPVLQEAIRKMRMMALDLRPSVLDEFGLESALDSIVSECNGTCDSERFHLDFKVVEDDLPKERKDILFRIGKDVTNRLCLMDFKGELKLTLSSMDQRLILSLDLQGEQWRWQEAAEEEEFINRNGFQSMREHAILSGGDFLATRSPNGHIRYQARWE